MKLRRQSCCKLSTVASSHHRCT